MKTENCIEEIIKVLKKYDFDYFTMIHILSNIQENLKGQVYLKKEQKENESKCPLLKPLKIEINSNGLN